MSDRTRGPSMTSASLPAAVISDPAFEARWSAWVGRGVMRDSVVRHRFEVLAPLMGVLSALALYLLSAR
jgi:hypothetical protein